MNNKQYQIFLDNKLIGSTAFEKADASMGVVFGNIIFEPLVLGYDFFKTYCLSNGIRITADYPDLKLISTASIPNLKVINPNGIELKSEGNQICGMQNDEFEITLEGIPYPFFKQEFPHHSI